VVCNETTSKNNLYQFNLQLKPLQIHKILEFLHNTNRIFTYIYLTNTFTFYTFKNNKIANINFQGLHKNQFTI